MTMFLLLLFSFHTTSFMFDNFSDFNLSGSSTFVIIYRFCSLFWCSTFYCHHSKLWLISLLFLIQFTFNNLLFTTLSTLYQSSTIFYCDNKPFYILRFIFHSIAVFVSNLWLLHLKCVSVAVVSDLFISGLFLLFVIIYRFCSLFWCSTFYCHHSKLWLISLLFLIQFTFNNLLFTTLSTLYQSSTIFYCDNKPFYILRFIFHSIAVFVSNLWLLHLKCVSVAVVSDLFISGLFLLDNFDGFDFYIYALFTVIYPHRFLV